MNNEQQTVRDYKNELSNIISIVKSLRKMKGGKHTSWEKPAEWHLKYSNINHVPELALTITLSPTGCEWAKLGGCTMCGEFEGAYKEDSLVRDPQFHIAQFAKAIGDPKVWETAKKEGKEIAWLRINQEGNYFNPKEMNNTAQFAILNLAVRIKGIKKITLESRPQYLTEEVVEKLHAIFKDTGIKLEIGMGLEAQDDIIRNVCINKQEKNTDFIRVVERLNRYNIDALAYIIIKPPFLTEMEAIDEAVATAHFAKDIGFSRISFEPMSIHPYTLIDALSQTGDYTAPWLWSVVEIAKRCKDISYMVGIGGVGYYPVPSNYSHNYCETDCNEQFIKTIMEYNRCRDVSVFDKLHCNCHEEWIQICRQTDVPLKERINNQLEKVMKILPEYTTAENQAASNMRSIRILGGDSQ